MVLNSMLNLDQNLLHYFFLCPRLHSSRWSFLVFLPLVHRHRTLFRCWFPLRNCDRPILQQQHTLFGTTYNWRSAKSNNIQHSLTRPLTKRCATISVRQKREHLIKDYLMQYQKTWNKAAKQKISESNARSTHKCHVLWTGKHSPRRPSSCFLLACNDRRQTLYHRHS